MSQLRDITDYKWFYVTSVEVLLPCNIRSSEHNGSSNAHTNFQ